MGGSIQLKIKGTGFTSDDSNRKENRVPKEESDLRPDLTISPVTVLREDTKISQITLGEPVVKRDNWPDQTTKDPKVCLTMIVKNEGKVLRRALKSVKGFVDEIVIIDTGSTDNTMDIAREFGAKIFEHPWEDSFSVARNWGIYHTDCQWLLQIDGDEELQWGDGSKIRDAVRSAHGTTTNLIHMILENIDEERKETQSVINTGKLMRVVPTLHFKNRVHNKLVCPGDVTFTTLKIFHYGYALPDKEYMQLKVDRTTKLLLMDAMDNPNDPDPFYYLSIQYLRTKDWNQAIEYSEQAVRLYKTYDPDSQLTLLAHHVGACAYYHMTLDAKSSNFDEAIRLCNEALEIYPDYIDSNSLLASIYFTTKDYNECFKYSEKYLAGVQMLKDDESKTLVVPMNTLKNEWLILTQLAINFFEQSKSNEGIYCIAKAEDLFPPEEKYKPTWTMFRYMMMRGDRASHLRAEEIYAEGFRVTEVVNG